MMTFAKTKKMGCPFLTIPACPLAGFLRNTSLSTDLIGEDIRQVMVVERKKGGDGRLGTQVGCHSAADEDCLEEDEHLYLRRHEEEEEESSMSMRLGI